MENVVDEMTKPNIMTTKTVFRTAYFVPKNNRPCTDHSSLLEMPNLNDVEIGLKLHSRKTSLETISHVSDEIKIRL